jgi:hypothetical protein
MRIDTGDIVIADVQGLEEANICVTNLSRTHFHITQWAKSFILITMISPSIKPLKRRATYAQCCIA